MGKGKEAPAPVRSRAWTWGAMERALARMSDSINLSISRLLFHGELGNYRLSRA
jgi:hypothetical protein